MTGGLSLRTPKPHSGKTQRVKPRATDPFTKGGQIFGHVWRMRWQNFKLMSALSSGGGVLGLAAHARVQGLTFLDFWEFYLLDYAGGHLKIWTWPSVQKVLLLADAWLKGLMRGSKGIPSAFLNVSQLMTTVSTGITPLEMPAYRIPTVLFLEEPWVLEKASQIHTCLGSGVLGFLIACLGCALFFKRQSQKLEEECILQGQHLASPDTLQKMLFRRGSASDLYLTSELSLVKSTEVEHLMVCGATRTGKTSTVLSLLIQVRAKKQKAVVLDLTGELTAKFFRLGQDALLNPLDLRSEAWDIFEEPLTEAEIEGWAASLVPAGDHDPIWSQAARKLLSVTAHQMHEKKKETPTLQTILAYACWKPLIDQDLQDFYKGTSLASLMQTSAEKTTAGIRMNLAAAIDAFKYFETGKEARFSIIKWIANENSGDWLFLTALPSQREALAPLLASWCNFAFLGLERLGPSRDRRLWFIVDEFPGLGHKIDALPRMVAEGAKYGACCVLSFQNKSQLDHLYNPHITKTILSNCNTKMIFRSPETSTAQFLSALLGKHEVFESAESISMGAHHIRDGVNLSPQQRLKPIVSETDIINLNKFEAFVQLPGDLPLTKVTVSPPQTENKNPAFISKNQAEDQNEESTS